jgi:hypothetical protein
VSGWPSGWVSGAGDSAVYGRGLREFSVVQKPTGLLGRGLATLVMTLVSSRNLKRPPQAGDRAERLARGPDDAVPE